MIPIYLTEAMLAKRWNMNPSTLRYWRQTGNGPDFIKNKHAVKYDLKEIERYEATQQQLMNAYAL